MHPTIPAALALASTVMAGIAQQSATDVPARRATVLRVVDVAGRPIADATVTCTGTVLHAEPWSDKADVVTATTDARGLARAALIPGLGYHGWALGPAAADGKRLSSTPNAWFGAGGVVNVLADVDLSPRDVVISGLEPWREFAPRIVVTTVLPGQAAVPLVVGADGHASVPALPPGQQWLQMRAANGELLWRTPLQAGPVAVPPPLRVSLRAEDKDGQPLAGVTVRLRDPKTQFVAFDAPLPVAPWTGARLIGVTAADGRLEAIVPADWNPFVGQQGDLLFEFDLPGHVRALSGAFASNWFVADRQIERQGPDVIVGVLHPDVPIRGKVNGAVAPGTRLELRTTAKLVTGDAGYILDPRAYQTTIGADGAFEFAGVPEFLHDSRLMLLPSAGAPLADALALPLVSATPERMVHEVVDVGAALRLRLRVLDARSGPAIGVTGYVQAVHADTRLVRQGATRFFVDPSGVADLGLTPGRWALFVANDSGHAAAVIDTTDTASELEMRMSDAMLWQLRVCDADGQPVVGAGLAVASVSFPVTKDPDLVALQVPQIAWLRHYLGRGRTGLDGELRLPFPDIGATVTASAQLGERQSERFKMTAALREREVRLR
ncbi:MAG: hypothetical protein IPK26_23105 [Planctomycetes bacterium]|nr:hypothetical protein [Planctomycetota bacterium]